MKISKRRLRLRVLNALEELRIKTGVISRTDLEVVLENAAEAIHELWGAVPWFCDHCDELTDRDSEICTRCGASLDEE